MAFLLLTVSYNGYSVAEVIGLFRFRLKIISGEKFIELTSEI